MSAIRAPRTQGGPSWLEGIVGLVALAAAGASGAVLFAIADAGYSTLQQLTQAVLLPCMAILVAIFLVSIGLRWRWLAGNLATGFLVGALATIALEAVRIVGFRVFDSMPGSMPMLMGELITGRIMMGPDTLSNLAGWGDHFWNGAMFGILYVFLVGRRRPLWVGIVFAWVLGTGFLLSPVPVAMGAGRFGLQFGLQFAATVYVAHTLFGASLAWLACRFGRGSALWERFAPHADVTTSAQV